MALILMKLKGLTLPFPFKDGSHNYMSITPIYGMEITCIRFSPKLFRVFELNNIEDFGY